ncbi:MAG TPA: hypothetical protein VFP83_06250 [Candidatus Limnocylindria bacterium]|nr:hypothetical protein [Candidatus Limnocylindria bacterium]
MNPDRVAVLIRRWVDLYTRGMPRAVRADRRAEVDDDLWCHRHDAITVGRSSGALGMEMMLRLVFGIPGDLSWRLAHGANAEAPGSVRRTSTSTRVIGTLAVLAGAGWTTLMLLMLVYGESAWTGSIGPISVVLVLGAGFAFTATAIGLIWRFQERLHRPGFIGGGMAGLGAFASAFNGAWAITLLPLGSAALAWDLARIGVLSFGTALLHALCAAALLVPLVAAFSADPAASFGFLALALPYPLSWMAIGVSLVRGVPSPRADSGRLSDGAS